MASIYFKNISFSNFMSYAQADIRLNRNGNILVGGINNNPEDNAKSNGCGKSTIFNALSWCLTGETVTGASDVANIYTEGKTEVTVEFEFDGNEYKITRTKNPSNLFIYINGENKSGKGIRDTSKLLADYIPQLTNNLLNSVIILGQGLPQKFTNNTPSGRKDVLEKLSNSEFMIEDLKNRLAERKKILDTQKRTLEDNILENETTTKVLDSQLIALKAELTSMPSSDTLIAEKEEYENKLKEIDEAFSSVKAKLESFENSLTESTQRKDVLRDELVRALDTLELEDTDSISQEIATIRGTISALEKSIRELDNVKDVCPTCGQKLPNVKKIDTSDKKKELAELKNKKSTLEDSLRAAENTNAEMVNQCRSKYDEAIAKATSEGRGLSIDISMQQHVLESLEREKTKLEKGLLQTTMQINNLEVTIKNLSDKIKESEDIIEVNKKQLYNYNEELITVNERLNINSKMTTLIKRDFRGYLLNNVISFIEDRAKSYSLEVFGTDKLAFELSGNNINISYDGKDYSCLSGGEKQKLDVIIQFSIRDMLCTFLDFSSNILVLDEITDALDTTGVSKIFNLINSNLSDVEAIYIISHHVDELEIPADDEILIIKGDDKISRIV